MYARIQLPSYLSQPPLETDIHYIQMLINANANHRTVQRGGFLFHNEELAHLVQPSYTISELVRLEQLLTSHGTTEPVYITGYHVTLPEGEQQLLLMPATNPTSHHGDMSQMVYLRDQIQVAESLLALHHVDPIRWEKEGATGKQLLMSALHLLSTPSQLRRFDTCIAAYSHGQLCRQSDWPQISLTYDNLDGNRPNGWRNIQDTIQMLAYAAVHAVETEQLHPTELLESHKQFLGAVVPLIASAGFPLYENSGSWEEVASRRTSVMAVETALLSKMFDLRIGKRRRALAFLAHEYQTYRQRHPNVRHFSMEFDELLSTLTQEGLLAISDRLPFESPSYARRSVKYRTVDMALTSLLRYNLPQLLVRYGITVSALGEPLAASAREHQLESMILDHLKTLNDPEGYGMFRYRGDSYQRVNWGTPLVQKQVADIKRYIAKEAANNRDGDIDIDLKQYLRGTLLPNGRQAAWSLGSAQIAAWAAQRFSTCQAEGDGKRAEHYRLIGTKALNRTLSFVTGDGQFTSTTNAKGTYQIKPTAAWQLPECYVTYSADDTRCTVPSAHTPLYWSAGLTKAAIGLLTTP